MGIGLTSFTSSAMPAKARISSRDIRLDCVFVDEDIVVTAVSLFAKISWSTCNFICLGRFRSTVAGVLKSTETKAGNTGNMSTWSIDDYP